MGDWIDITGFRQLLLQVPSLKHQVADEHMDEVVVETCRKTVDMHLCSAQGDCRPIEVVSAGDIVENGTQVLTKRCAVALDELQRQATFADGGGKPSRSPAYFADRPSPETETTFKERLNDSIFRLPFGAELREDVAVAPGTSFVRASKPFRNEQDQHRGFVISHADPGLQSLVKALERVAKRAELARVKAVAEKRPSVRAVQVSRVSKAVVPVVSHRPPKNALYAPRRLSAVPMTCFGLSDDSDTVLQRCGLFTQVGRCRQAGRGSMATVRNASTSLFEEQMRCAKPAVTWSSFRIEWPGRDAMTPTAATCTTYRVTTWSSLVVFGNGRHHRFSVFRSTTLQNRR
jgi:hypothetical protein